MAISQGAGAAAIDVADFINRQPVGGFQIKLLAMCAAVLFLDGFDAQAISYVAPALVKEWGLTRAALGPVFSASLFGLMIGALGWPPGRVWWPLRQGPTPAGSTVNRWPGPSTPPCRFHRRTPRLSARSAPPWR